MNQTSNVLADGELAKKRVSIAEELHLIPGTKLQIFQIVISKQKILCYQLKKII